MREVMMRRLAIVLAFTFVFVHAVLGGDIWGTGEVPRLTDPGSVPQTLEEVWAGYEKNYDEHNPLEAIVHKTWQREGDIEVNWVQLTVGSFQGKKAIVCGYWAYPKGAKALPGLVMFHGGPQTASEDGAVNWAKLGYACFHPNHNDRAKMGGKAAGLPNTDWDAVNAWGAKGPDSPFQADKTTVDAAPSPRNSWQFPRQMSGRRIISFLAQQPQVDAKRIGVRGHSTGGSLTTLVSIDPRVAAAVPSVGGVGGFMDVHPVITGNTRHLRLQGERRKLFDETLEMRTVWAHMHAPVLLLGASNDFNAPDWNCLEALKRATVDKRYASCANYNHSFPPETMVADYLWFQDKLKGAFTFPPAPKAELLLDRATGVPVFRVTPPETELALKRVEMFYTDGRNPLTRFWTTGAPQQNADGSWEIACPVLYNDEPLTAFANIIYAIDPIQAPHHSYDGLSEMAATSNYAVVMPEQLQQSSVKPSFQQSRTIDDFAAGLRDWGGNLGNGHRWNIDTRKVADARFMGPKGAELVLEVNSPAPGQTMGVLIERNFMEANFREHAFYTFVELPKQGWNTIRIKTRDLRNPFGWALDDWHKVSRLTLMSAPSLKKKIEGDLARVAGSVAQRQGAGDSKYVLNLGAVPDKVSGWDEAYYQEAGDEYTKFNMTTKDDVLARQRFRNLRWEGGAYVARTKPYEREPYVQPSLAPPDVWQDYDPDAGNLNEEIISEETKDGIYYKESYISAYVNGEDVRVYCKYAVKAGAKNAPGLLNVHGWMGGPAIDMAYVHDGWAVMAHDYSGITNRPHFTKYPKALAHGHMDARKMGFSLIYGKMPDGSQLTDPKATSHYLWNAVQRRALSYLLAQQEVDHDRIGAKGYSYGGTIMWNLAMDARVKAVVAYFGIGWIDYYRNRAVWRYNVPHKNPAKTPGEALFLSAVAPQAHAPHITAASLWLNGSNDHHGGHERGCETFKSFKAGVPWDFAIQARGHHNTEKLGDDCRLWLEKHVLDKNHFWPARPESEIKLDAAGVPELQLTPASPERIKELQVYQCLKTANNIERYWRDVPSERRGNTWIAKLPVMHVADYVFSYANIRYDNDCVVSSDFEAVIPAKLGNAVATDTRSDVLPGGADRWSHVAPAEGVGGIEGFRPIDNRRGTQSGQFADPKWKAPRGANLTFKFYCTQPQSLVLWADRFATDIEISASDEWQSMTVQARTLKQQSGQALADWSTVKTIGFKPKPGEDITKVIFAAFKWEVSEAQTPSTPVADKDGKVYLTGEMASACETFWRVLDDRGVEGKPLSVGGKQYDRGLGVHADSKISFPLNGAFAAFHVVPGPDDAHKGLLEMKILVDGKEVYASGAVSSSGFKAKPLTLPVVGARELTLIVTDGGNGKGGDHASWADAHLVK